MKTIRTTDTFRALIRTGVSAGLPSTVGSFQIIAPRVSGANAPVRCLHHGDESMIRICPGRTVPSLQSYTTLNELITEKVA